MKCENCDKEHDGSYGSGRFCSDHCRRVYSGKHVNVNGKHKCNFKNNVNSRRPKAEYGRWKCKCCAFIGNTRRELEDHVKSHNGHYICMFCKTEFSTMRKLVGHRNFCKFNPLREQIIQNVSKSLKGKRHSHSKETREKLSEIRSKQLDSCTAGFQNVGWYKVKNLNGVEYTVRGHWEENVANKLTNDNVLWIKNYSLKYLKDGIRKTYNPDFYLPMTNEFIEVKGYYSSKDKEKMKLVLEQNDVKIYFIDQYHYHDYINGKVNLSELLMK